MENNLKELGQLEKFLRDYYAAPALRKKSML
jgi:hypothetical protein